MHGKRIFDLGVASLVSAAFAPLMGAIAILIRMREGSPVIFAQVRVGREGQRFKMYKFRTMRTDAEGLSVSATDDDRITPLGRRLRATKLDELPQLWNVMLGDMSLVGPRPEVPEFVDMWTDEDRRVILSVKPGITDPASVEFRNEGDLLAAAADPRDHYIKVVMPQKCALYREYVEHRTILGDLWIGVQTVAAVAGRRPDSTGVESGEEG